jgi:hypothetical protein
VRVEIQGYSRPQTGDKVVDRRIRPRLPPRLRPDINEDIVTVRAALLAVQVIGIKPDQLPADGDRPAAGLGAGAVRVLPRHDADLPLGCGDVLMPQAEHFACATACLVKQGEEEPVPQPRARVQDRLRLGDGQDRGSFCGTLSEMARPRYGFPLLTWCRNGFQPPLPPDLQTASRSPTSAPLRAWCA